MKSAIVFGSIALCLGFPLCGQDPPKKALLSEYAKTVRVKGAFPTGPFETAPGETYKGPPLLKFIVEEDGSVSNVRLKRSSGLTNLDKKTLTAVGRWRYKPRPTGCGAIDTEMTVLIHWGPG